MQWSIFPLLGLLHLVSSLPQLKFSPEEYKALKVALKHDKPLYVIKAIPALPLLIIKNIQSDKYFLHDALNTLNSKGFKFNEIKVRKQFKDILDPIYRIDALNIKPISKRRSFTALDNNIRRKRQTSSDDAETIADDEEEEPTVYAEELGFGLSTAGGVLGGALGGYLDTTGQATIKLIKSLENLGLLAVSQIDMAMDRQEEQKRKEQEERKKANQNSSYEVPDINNSYDIK